jgi:hypothetical protein
MEMYTKKFNESKNPVPLKIKSFFSTIKSEVERRFNDGYATCPYAVYTLLKKFPEYKNEFKVADGEYRGEPHYFVVWKDSWIIDFGNNIFPKSIITGQIYPHIMKYPAANYKVDEFLTVDAFLRLYPKIKNY